jgi:hypothetical protein
MNAWYFQGADTLSDDKNPSEAPFGAKNILEDGYVVLRQSIAASTIDEILFHYKTFKGRVADLNPPSVQGRYRRLVNLHCAVPSLFKLFYENQAALKVLDYFFNETAELYTSLFYEIGSGQEPHRDTPYFWTNPGYKYFGVWVALEDVDRGNGCLQVIPKSHLLPEEDRDSIPRMYYQNLSEIPPSDDRLWSDYQNLSNLRAKECGLELIDVEIKKGDTIIWHPHTLHGGRPIADAAKTRLSFVMHVTPPQQAVFHHQGFFNSGSVLPVRSSYEVVTFNSRSHRRYENISFEHLLDINIDDLM